MTCHDRIWPSWPYSHCQADSVCNQFEHLISLWRSHAAMVTDLAIQDAYENRWRRDADDGWVKVDEWILKYNCDITWYSFARAARECHWAVRFKIWRLLRSAETLALQQLLASFFFGKSKQLLESHSTKSSYSSWCWSLNVFLDRWSSGSWSDQTEPVRMDVNGNKALTWATSLLL